MRNMKRSKQAKKKNLLIRGFIRSGCMILLMFLAGFLTYKATIGIYNITNGEDVHRKLDTDLKQDGKVDSVCKNLIYIINNDDRIEGIVLEVLNTYTDSLTYITIPKTTQFALDTEQYRQLYAINNQLPQIVTVRDLLQYFSQETAFESIQKIMTEFLGTDISCYTIIGTDASATIFEEEERTTTLASSEIYTNKTLILKEELLSEIPEDKELIYNYIANFYKVAKSNLMLEQKKKYVASYSRVNKDYIYYYCIPGMQQSDNFTVNEQETKDLVKQVINADEYKETQQEWESKNIIPSTDKNIVILNGSKVTGMATRYSEKLKGAGYQISQIGNYAEELIEVTNIQVREEGMGRDLLSFFNEATIEVASLPEGIDIQIILGTSEK